MGKNLIVFLLVMLLISSKAAAQLNFKRSLDTAGRNVLLRPLPQNFYNQSLGYFCKKENQLQKITKLPFYLRLGSKDYTDYLERKPNALKRD
jgi:hypothetical protein